MNKPPTGGQDRVDENILHRRKMDEKWRKRADEVRPKDGGIPWFAGLRRWVSA